MLPIFAALAQPLLQSPEPVVASRKGYVELRLGESTLLRGKAATEGMSAAKETAGPWPLQLGYPHGPKDAQYVAPNGHRRTLVVQLAGPVDAQIEASPDSFMCNDRGDAPLGSAFGDAENRLNNGVYDRTGDWLLTAEGSGVTLTREGQGRYRLRVAKGSARLRFRQDYYRNHLGYFLWDNKRPLWPRPVAGWCSWMAHKQDVTEKDVLTAARFFSNNLKDYGYDVIQIDDGYQRVMQFAKDDAKATEPFSRYWTVPNEKFPSGLQTLATEISGLGLTPGIWIGDYLPLGLKNEQGYVTGPDGKPFKGPWVNYAMNALIPEAREEAYIQTVRDLRSQGWRYFKIDTLRHVLYDSYRKVPEYWTKRGESMEAAFRTLMDETKKAAGPDSYVLACWGTMPELAGLPDGARIGEDVDPDIPSMRRTAKYIAQFHYLNDVVWRNDPDYMTLRVPVPQAEAWATLTALAGGHVMVSDPVKDYDEARVDILRRVGPPLPLRPNTVVAHAPDPELMTLSAAKDGEQWLVASRLAWGAKPPRSVRFDELGLDASKRYLAFDFWRSGFLGTVSGEVPFAALQDGTTQVISLRPALDRPQILGTDRHIGQGAHELEGVRWAGNTLSGRFKRAPGREWSVFFHVPQGWQYVSAEGGKAEVNGPVVKLTFADGGTPAEFKARFRKG